MWKPGAPKPPASLPEVMPMKPESREKVPSLTAPEYDRLCELVDMFPTLRKDQPELKEWEGLQRRADKDMLENK